VSQNYSYHAITRTSMKGASKIFKEHKNSIDLAS